MPRPRPTSKWCGGCSKTLPIDAFYRVYKDADARASRCKTCMASYRKAWLAKKRAAAKARAAE